jgi:hypothetical protein
MSVLCGDTIYNCCKFLDLMENENCYTLYLRHDQNIKHIVCVFTKSDVLTVRTTDVKMQQLLQMMLVIIQTQQGPLCYHAIMEIFLKEGYYLSENVFKLLRVCGGRKVRMVSRLGACVSHGGIRKSSGNSIL